jgi:hypothetical protein
MWGHPIYFFTLCLQRSWTDRCGNRSAKFFRNGQQTFVSIITMLDNSEAPRAGVQKLLTMLPRRTDQGTVCSVVLDPTQPPAQEYLRSLRSEPRMVAFPRIP